MGNSVTLFSVLITALISLFTSIIVVLLKDRFYPLLNSEQRKREIKQSAPQLQYRVYKNCERIIPATEDPKYFMHVIDPIDRQSGYQIVLEKVTADYKMESSVALYRIINSTQSGVTIDGIFGMDPESMMLPSDFLDIDIDPGKSVYIYGESAPPLISRIQLRYLEYYIVFSIERSSDGYIIPEIKKIK